jgi:hypothetical protein
VVVGEREREREGGKSEPQRRLLAARLHLTNNWLVCSLTSLSIVDNDLIDLPNHILKLRGLIQLKVDGNPLSYVVVWAHAITPA